MASTADVRTADGLDPLTLDVFWTRLQAMLDEQARAVQRTAFSTVVREAGDCSVGVFDTHGDMIGQAVTGTPGHIFALPACVRHLLSVFEPSTLQLGDVLITNDPYLNCGHQYDFTIATPVFHHGRFVAMYASTCHVLDIGGRFDTGGGRDVFEEGLIIPPLRLYRAGVLDEGLVALIRANVRTPLEDIGDMHALVGTNHVGARRLGEVMDELGLTGLDEAGAEIMARSERATRAAVAAIDDGSYANVAQFDAVGEDLVIAVTLTVAGDQLHVDYTGSSPRNRKGINVVFNYTHAYTTYALKCALTPDVPNNQGSLRPITVTAPRDTLLNAVPPAPVALRHAIGHFLPGAVYGALGKAIPERVLAEGSGALWSTDVNGVLDGRRFIGSFMNAGGIGARFGKDGLSSTSFPTGTTSVPVEVTESIAPILFHRRQLRTDSGGAGQWRGGSGQTIEFEVRSDTPVVLSTSPARLAHPAQGMRGGQAGLAGSIEVGDRSVPELAHVREIASGQRVTMHLPGGGGMGDPRLRDPQAVLRDVQAGYVSREAATRDYGVVIDAAASSIDAAQTARLRSG
jgi:N-methylhydantoinase B